MLVQYSNFIAFHSFTDDFLELVDLIDEKSYKPSIEAGHDVHDEIKRLQMGKFDKDKVFKMTFNTESKTYDFTGNTLERPEFFNDVAFQETNRDINYIKETL